MTVEITRLHPEDKERWTALWRGYLDFYHTELPDEVYQDTWQRLLHDTVLHGFCARQDGSIVGITHFLFHASTWTTIPVCYLQDLYVDPASRGGGAGRAAPRLYWLTQSDNTLARTLYDRIAKHNGFIRYEYALG